MNGLPYYQRFPRKFFEGTIGLDFETKAAYGLLLDLIYIAGLKGLPDDARYIAGHMGCSVRKWNTIRRKLIEAGKIRCDRGIISNSRADDLLEKTRKYQDNQAENARGSKDNKGLREPPLESGRGDKERDQERKKEDTPPPPITPPAREAPAVSGGGGDFQSDEEKGGAEIDALLGEVREASGVRVVDVAAGRATVRRWLGLGLGREEIIAQVRARTEKLMAKDPPDPPFALAAFDVSMDQLAAAKAREPKLRPVQVVTTTPEERFEANVATAGRLMEATGSLPDWLKTPEIAAALIERDLATYDHLRRIMRPEDLPRRKA